MRKNPARFAWSVLLSSFILCVASALLIPLSLRWYVLRAETAQPALLSVTSGTVLLLPEDADEPIAVVDSRQVEPGTLIQTDQTSQALIAFSASDNLESPELATVQVYPNAQLLLYQHTKPRFTLSTDPNQIGLELRSGRIRVNRSELEPRGLLFDVKTPHSLAHLGPGSYSLDVANQQTLVSTRYGEAQVDGSGIRVTVDTGNSTVVTTDAPPTPPEPAAENLIVNGDFQEGIGQPHWLVSNYPPEDPSAGTAETTTIGGRNAVRFSRINLPPNHTEVGITQVLEQGVHDYEYLNLQMDVMLRWQSLPGAGEQSSEFPLMFRLDYEDVYGNHQFWTHGFFYRDPPEQWNVTGGEKIPQNIWFPFESGNLMERLPLEGLPPPATINWVKIYASGHNYDSLASEVRLAAR